MKKILVNSLFYGIGAVIATVIVLGIVYKDPDWIKIAIIEFLVGGAGYFYGYTSALKKYENKAE